jgi:hypothetical protein
MQQIKIDAIDNGYVMSWVDISTLQQRPFQKVMYFATLSEVTEHITKQNPQLTIVK